MRQATTEHARKLVQQLRAEAKPGLMETFLGEYGLSSDEGVALMCLAEALLRVPDSETMDALAMREMGRQFVLGQTIEEALKNRRAAYRYSFDMLGEAAISTKDARRYERAYCEAIEALAPFCNSVSVHDNPGISVKLSALHPRYETLQRERVLAELLPRITELASGRD